MWDLGGWDNTKLHLVKTKEVNSKERNRLRQGNYPLSSELFDPGQHRIVVARAEVLAEVGIDVNYLDPDAGCQTR